MMDSVQLYSAVFGHIFVHFVVIPSKCQIKYTGIMLFKFYLIPHAHSAIDYRSVSIM